MKQVIRGKQKTCAFTTLPRPYSVQGTLPSQFRGTSDPCRWGVSLLGLEFLNKVMSLGKKRKPLQYDAPCQDHSHKSRDGRLQLVEKMGKVSERLGLLKNLCGKVHCLKNIGESDELLNSNSLLLCWDEQMKEN